jgi:hypothetical protein
MFGDYPTEGWRMWAFVAGTTTVGFVGLVLMVIVNGS